MVDERSSRSKKIASNVLGSSFYKGINIVFNLLIVRYSISFIGTEQYGVWLTLFSVLTWFSTLESGISNSFRNQLTQYFVDGKSKKIKQLISKGYKALIITYLSIILILLSISYLFPIESFFVSGEDQSSTFQSVFRLSVLFFLTQYIFFFVNSILLATHHVISTYRIIAIQNGILLLGLFIANFLGLKPSLLLYAIWFSLVPTIVWLIVNLTIYIKTLKPYKPSIKKILTEKSQPFKQLNKNYLIIQFSILVLFSSDNLIIMSQLSGNDVSIYNLSFKYFNIINVIFNLILVPYWSSFAEAYYKKDKSWIKSSIKKLLFIWIGILTLAIVMLICSSFAYKLWIGKDLHIPMRLSIFMATAVLLNCWNNIFGYFLRGVSIIEFEKNLLLFSAIINIPLSFYFLATFNSTGVIIATCISLLPMAVLLPIKYKSVLNKMEEK